MKTLRRPMFRKGGNVGTGVMTGIVDRGNYAFGDRVQEQDITDYISLVKGGGRKKGFFKKCVEKMKDKMENPEGFCASVKDEAWDSTYWRGKKKSEYQTNSKTISNR